MAFDSGSMDGNRNGEAEVTSAPSERHPARGIAFAIASMALAVACVVLALQYFVAERLPDLTDAALQAATERWNAHGPANYDMDVEIRGAQPGIVHVEVQDKQVTAETRDGRIPPRHTWDTWSVPGMLDMLSQDMATAENPEQMIQAPPGTKWRLRCEFDPKLGIPMRYHRLVTSGPEVYWVVTSFQPK
jgi:hypothetical protein